MLVYDFLLTWTFTACRSIPAGKRVGRDRAQSERKLAYRSVTARSSLHIQVSCMISPTTCLPVPHFPLPTKVPHLPCLRKSPISAVYRSPPSACLPVSYLAYIPVSPTYVPTYQTPISPGLPESPSPLPTRLSHLPPPTRVPHLRRVPEAAFESLLSLGPVFCQMELKPLPGHLLVLLRFHKRFLVVSPGDHLASVFLPPTRHPGQVTGARTPAEHVC